MNFIAHADALDSTEFPVKGPLYVELLPRFTQFNRVFVVSLVINGLGRVFTEFYWVSIGFTGFYWVFIRCYVITRM